MPMLLPPFIGLSGFFLLGPYSMSSGCLTLDIAGSKGAGSCTGMIDGFGYVGIALSVWVCRKVIGQSWMVSGVCNFSGFCSHIDGSGNVDEPKSFENLTDKKPITIHLNKLRQQKKRKYRMKFLILLLVGVRRSSGKVLAKIKKYMGIVEQELSGQKIH